MSKPTKRTVLPLLTVKRLAGLCDELGVERSGLTLKDDLVDAIARARTAPLPEILGQLSRNELKELCRAHNLDDSGKEKAVLVARLLGEQAPQTAKPPVQLSLTNPEPRAVPPSPESEPEIKRFGSFSEITSFLWSVADRLRGTYKQSDYGKVILPFTVLRRLDCVLEPTKAKVLARHEALKGGTRPTMTSNKRRRPTPTRTSPCHSSSRWRGSSSIGWSETKAW